MGYYVTKKRVQEYINSNKKRFSSYEQFLGSCRDFIKELESYPIANRNQLRFFKKVEERLSSLALLEFVFKD